MLCWERRLRRFRRNVQSTGRSIEGSCTRSFRSEKNLLTSGCRLDRPCSRTSFLDQGIEGLGSCTVLHEGTGDLSSPQHQHTHTHILTWHTSESLFQPAPCLSVYPSVVEARDLVDLQSGPWPVKRDLPSWTNRAACPENLIHPFIKK